MTARKALVTGGSKGIGLAIALALEEAGHDVMVVSRTPPKEGDLRWLECDLERLVGGPGPFLTSTMNTIEGGYDILVNNMGGGGRWGGPYLGTRTGEAVYDRVYLKNAGIAADMTRRCVPHMVKAGWGRVVTIASIHGKEAGGRPWFNMAKAAEIALMKSLAQDKTLVRRGITFNTVAPGHISVAGKPDEEDLEALPLGRMGKPVEVAAVVAFLCSERASLVNGACIAVDGGESRSY